MLGAGSHAEVAGTYSSTHPMEGEGPRRGYASWVLVMRDGPEAPRITTRAEIEAFLAEVVRRDKKPASWHRTFLLRLGSRGGFAFRGPLSYGEESPALVSGTWHIVGDDVVLSPARATPTATCILEHEIVCHLEPRRLYFPWGDQTLAPQELMLVKR